MGAILHMGDSIGATPPIDDSSVSDKKLWSSQKTKTAIDNVGTWDEIEILYTGTYGQLSGIYNSSIHMATLRWAGNSETPSSNKITVQLPAKYKSKLYEVVAPLHRATDIYVTPNTTVEIQLSNLNWSSGIITYPTDH